MVVFLDGASHYSTSELSLKWTAVDSSACTFTIEAADGRTEGAIKRVSSSNADSGFLTKAPLYTQDGIWSAQTTGIFGCALKIDDLAGLQDGNPRLPAVNELENAFLVVYSASWATIAFTINTDGTFSVWRLRQLAFGGSILLATSTGGLTSGSYHYVEVKWTMSAGDDGLAQVKIDGNTNLTFNGRTVPNASENFPFAAPAASWTSVTVLGMDSAVSPLLTARMCDVYLADNVEPNGDYLGDISIAVIRHDGEGSVSGWTPSAGDNWEDVDEVPPNSDTDYVETSAVDTRDNYTFEDVPGSPAAIQVCTFTKKTTAGAASLAVSTRQSSTNYDGPSQGLSGTSYQYLLQPYDTNPDTGEQWTQAEMNAGQWGPLKTT
jgi:hypothetical protein